MMQRTTHIEYADFREAVNGFPFLADIVFVADDDDMFQLVVVVVTGTQWHDEVAQSDERWLGLSEQTDYDVVAQYRLRSLITVL